MPSSARNSLMMIDDVRYFGKEKDYPTLQAMEPQVLARRPGADIAVENDRIRTTPKKV